MKAGSRDGLLDSKTSSSFLIYFLYLFVPRVCHWYGINDLHLYIVGVFASNNTQSIKPCRKTHDSSTDGKALFRAAKSVATNLLRS